MAISRIESETATQPLSNHLKGQRGSLAAAHLWSFISRLTAISTSN
jgi:hypothetical protein